MIAYVFSLFPFVQWSCCSFLWRNSPKNWLFCDTQAGANASVIVFTVLETAKANGLIPEAYLNHILTVLPDRFAVDPKASADDLMPWAEEMQTSFRTSDAEH